MREFKPVPEDLAMRQVEIFNLAFHDNARVKYWKIKHYSQVRSVVYGDFYNGRLMGINAFLDMEYAYSGMTFKAAESCDAAADPDYKEPGSFMGIVRTAERDYKKQGYDFLFGLPNESSLPGFQAMGWTEAVRVKRMFLPASIVNIAGQKGIRLPGFANLISYIMWHKIRRCAGRCHYEIVKKAEISQNEYLSFIDKNYIAYHPGQDELAWKLDDLEGVYEAKHRGRIIGRMIVSSYFYSSGFRRANIAAAAVRNEDREAYQNMLSKILVQLKQKFDLFCIYEPKEEWKKKALKELCFLHRKNDAGTPCMIKILTDDAQKAAVLKDREKWNPLMLEMDTMLSLNGRTKEH